MTTPGDELGTGRAAVGSPGTVPGPGRAPTQKRLMPEETRTREGRVCPRTRKQLALLSEKQEPGAGKAC